MLSKNSLFIAFGVIFVTSCDEAYDPSAEQIAFEKTETIVEKPIVSRECDGEQPPLRPGECRGSATAEAYGRQLFEGEWVTTAFGDPDYFNLSDDERSNVALIWSETVFNGKKYATLELTVYAGTAKIPFVYQCADRKDYIKKCEAAKGLADNRIDEIVTLAKTQRCNQILNQFVYTALTRYSDQLTHVGDTIPCEIEDPVCSAYKAPRPAPTTTATPVTRAPGVPTR